MNTPAPGMAWATQHPAFCFTLTRACTPPHVLITCRTGPNNARMLTRQDLLAQGITTQHGSVLRTGTLSNWAFCFEDGEPEGVKPRLLSRLSTGTEALALFRGADGTDTFQQLIDGHRTEHFGPGMHGTEQGGTRHFSHAVHALLHAAPTTLRIVAALKVIADHTGAGPDQNLLDGPLLTAVLPDRDREPGDAPTSPAPARPRLGKPLGAVRLSATPPPATQQPSARRPSSSPPS